MKTSCSQHRTFHSVCVCVAAGGGTVQHFRRLPTPEADRKLLNRRRETVVLWTCAKVNKSGPFFLKAGEGRFVENAQSAQRSSCGYENTLCKQFIQHRSERERENVSMLFPWGWKHFRDCLGTCSETKWKEAIKPQHDNLPIKPCCFCIKL